jgi:flagellin-specific chaperone FliS
MQFMFGKLSSEEIKVLKIISNGSDLQFKLLKDDTPERIKRLVKSYNNRLPLINDLNLHGITIKDISQLHPSQASDDIYKKAVPILVLWLKKKDTDKETKAIIISNLIEKPYSKLYAFDIILDLFKSTDRNEKDEDGYESILPLYIGNALLRWVDDSYADIILSFLKDKKLRKDNFLLESLGNFKNSENIQKAKEIVIQELKSSPDKDRLGAIFVVLKKLKVIEAEKLVEPYIKNKDSNIRSEAKKMMHVFEKIHQSKN